MEIMKQECEESLPHIEVKKEPPRLTRNLQNDFRDKGPRLGL